MSDAFDALREPLIPLAPRPTFAATLRRRLSAELGSTTTEEHAMPETAQKAIAVVGIDIGKNSFHVVGQDERGAIVLRQKWSRGQVEARLANLPPCLIGMEACVGAHHLSRKLKALGHDARLTGHKAIVFICFKALRIVRHERCAPLAMP